MSFATNLSIVPLRLLLTVPAVSVPGLIFCLAKFIDECKWKCSYIELAKKYIICIWCTVLIKVQQPLIKVPSRTYCNNLEELWSQIYPLEEDKEMLVLHRINRLKCKLVCPLPLCSYNISIINYRWKLWNKGCFIWSSSVHTEWILNWTIFCFIWSVFLGILSARFWCLSAPEKFLISLLEKHSEKEIFS